LSAPLTTMNSSQKTGKKKGEPYEQHYRTHLEQGSRSYFDLLDHQNRCYHTGRNRWRRSVHVDEPGLSCCNGNFRSNLFSRCSCSNQGKGLSPIPLLGNDHCNNNSRDDVGGFRRPLSWNRLCRGILAIVCSADSIIGHLVSVTWHDIGRYRQFSKGR